MGIRYALVPGCDLTRDGTKLGPHTILRQQRSLQHARDTGDILVVAASWSPHHPQQPKPMAEMMADWYAAHGYTETKVLEATTFRTQGELAVFLSCHPAAAIISDPIHLERIRVLIERDYGKARAEELDYIPTASPAMSAFAQKLEPYKLFYVKYVPRCVDDRIWRLVTWASGKFGINLSY